ncbi:MAG: AI-2E family transporter [Candidatus Poseidoniales archaeon]|nr:MAG: AI-2E family transporter [Candidatus Poseidoniales archaeon]
METKTRVWDGSQFRHRLTVLSHAAIIMTLVTIWLVYLIDVLQPLFIALGTYFVLKPGADYMSKKGFPLMLSYITMLLLAILLVLGAGFFAYQQAATLLDDEDRMDEYMEKLDVRWEEVKNMPVIGQSLLDSGATENGSIDQDLTGMGVLSDDSGVQDAVSGLLASVGSLFIMGVTVLFFLLFIIFEASLLPGRIERAYPGGASERVHMIRDQIEASVNTYVVVKTGVGFGTGVCAGIVMLFFGIDLWFTWALLTFLLNYVPYIGSLLATIPPLILGFILLDPSMLLVMSVLLLGNQQLWGNVIETRWAGRALDISPVLLLVVTAFSFWVWGVVGMILSIPLIVILKIVLENIEATRPLAILLSERAPTLEEAWREAIKDGRITAYEERMLRELQDVLGYSDKQVKLISARIAAEYALRRGRLSLDQINLIRVGISMMEQPRAWGGQFEDIVTEGKLSVMERLFIGKLIFALDDDEEE